MSCLRASCCKLAHSLQHLVPDVAGPVAKCIGHTSLASLNRRHVAPQSSSPWLPAGASAGPDLASQFSSINSTKELIAKASESRASAAVPALQPASTTLRLFRRLPYRLRRILTDLPPALAAVANVEPYRLPDVHVVPRYALAIDPARTDAGLGDLESLGFDHQGRTLQPLADVATWKLERALNVRRSLQCA